VSQAGARTPPSGHRMIPPGGISAPWPYTPRGHMATPVTRWPGNRSPRVPPARRRRYPARRVSRRR